MRFDNAVVKSRKEVLGTVQYPVFESLDEAVSHFGSESEVLDIVNRQVKTDEQNRFRAAKTGRPSRLQLQEQAFSRLMASGRLAEIQALPEEERAGALRQATTEEVAKIKSELGLDKDDEEEEDSEG